ncbi:WG repeat-containing protein [Polaribacter sp. L3A8]|uniref:WG repeat-containing protein n=1 Tax=Polaribacter sp. L3A8 TaxID=2686361 RepID=UPI00131B2BD3|nr:WG repeat-containing protein [Polaribacter sp. L3A8]
MFSKIFTKKLFNLLPYSTRMFIIKKYGINNEMKINENIKILVLKNGNYGVFNKNKKILIEPLFFNITHWEKNNWFECKKYVKNYREKGVSPHISVIYDLNGKLLKEINLKLLEINEFGNLIVSDGKKRGILSGNFKLKIPVKYDWIIQLTSNRFRVILKDENGIVDSNNNLILDLKYRRLLGNFKRGFVFAEDNRGTYKVAINGELYFLPYTYIRFPHSNIDSAPSKEDLNDKLKVIIDKTNEYYNHKHNEEIRRGDHINEMEECSGKWGIIDTSGKEIIKPSYSFIDFFESSDYYKVFKGKMIFNFNKETFRETMEGAKSGVINKNNKIIVPIEYDWIEELEKGIFAVNNGGIITLHDGDDEWHQWTVDGGKWGIINKKSKLLVPIKYDTIMNTWVKRKREYFFVQNGIEYGWADEYLDYDVFDLKGNKIKTEKPKYKNHR